MAKHILPSAQKAGLAVCGLLLIAMSGCATDGPRRSGYRGGPAAHVVVMDDYDYYPGYETYYSRNRHEYIYRDGNAWVRRPAPRGVTASVFLAAPSVRMDFHDSPEQHNSSVVRSYPKNWKRPDQKPAAKDDHRTDKKNNDRRDGDKKN